MCSDCFGPLTRRERLLTARMVVLVSAYALFGIGKPQPLVLRAVCMAGKAAAVVLKFATVCIVCTRLYLVRAVCMHTLVT